PDRIDVVFVSHVHEDHFDQRALQGLPGHTPVLCADFPSRGLLRAWRALGFDDVTVLAHGETTELATGVNATVLCDTSHREDSALMIEAEGVRFLDLNDCLVQFGELPTAVDLMTRQFSGAMWYPNCYDYPAEVMADKVRTVRRNLFQTLV